MLCAVVTSIAASGDVFALVPTANCTIKQSLKMCYQGTMESLTKVQNTDPLNFCRDKGATAIHNANCSVFNYTVSEGFDPVYKKTSLWRLPALNDADANDLPPKTVVLASVKSVLDYALKHNIDSHGKHNTERVTNCGWTHGAMMQGTMAAYRATADESYLDYAMWWGEENKWITCNYPKVLTEHAAANDMSCGQTYAEVYLNAIASGKGKNDTFIAHIRDEVLQVLVDRPQVDDWWWDDAYFMAMGTFARIGTITGDAKFHDKCFALFNDSATRRGLWSEEGQLFFRDETYKNKTSAHGQHVFWGRGEGWTSGALARAMEFTPTSHPSYAVYAKHLTLMAQTLKRVQSADGMWRASVLDPTDPCCLNPETTGTSGMTFGLAWGVNSGVLDRDTYAPVVAKAWNGLQKLAVGDDGLLGYCQPVGGGPQPAKQDDTSDFCVGLFLLAGEQVAKMAA